MNIQTLLFGILFILFLAGAFRLLSLLTENSLIKKGFKKKAISNDFKSFDQFNNRIFPKFLITKDDIIYWGRVSEFCDKKDFRSFAAEKRDAYFIKHIENLGNFTITLKRDSTKNSNEFKFTQSKGLTYYINVKPTTIKNIDLFYDLIKLFDYAMIEVKEDMILAINDTYEETGSDIEIKIAEISKLIQKKEKN